MAPARTVSELSEAVATLADGHLPSRWVGNGGLRLAGVASLEAAGPADLAFLANLRYRKHAQASAAGALVLAEAQRAALFADGRAGGVLIVCDDPYAWFAFAAQLLSAEPVPAAIVAASAHVDPTAHVDSSARVDAHAVIEAGAHVGAGAWIGAACVLGPGSRVGEGTRLHAGVRLCAGCRIGARGIVHSGAVIGADGFGFAPFRGRWVKIPQTGIVAIGDDVEIGANTTIDRGSTGDTLIGEGVKIDNQVQIGHNCRIGDHTAIAGCVGIAGSAVIGRNCQLGGAAMIHGHLSIADGTIVGAGTLVSRSLTQADFYTGVFPIMRNRDWERNAALVRHLVELRDRIRRLERHAPPVSADETDASERGIGRTIHNIDNEPEPTP